MALCHSKLSLVDIHININLVIIDVIILNNYVR